MEVIREYVYPFLNGGTCCNPAFFRGMSRGHHIAVPQMNAGSSHDDLPELLRHSLILRICQNSHGHLSRSKKPVLTDRRRFSVEREAEHCHGDPYTEHM